MDGRARSLWSGAEKLSFGPGARPRSGVFRGDGTEKTGILTGPRARGLSRSEANEVSDSARERSATRVRALGAGLRVEERRSEGSKPCKAFNGVARVHVCESSVTSADWSALVSCFVAATPQSTRTADSSGCSTSIPASPKFCSAEKLVDIDSADLKLPSPLSESLLPRRSAGESRRNSCPISGSSTSRMFSPPRSSCRD